MGKIPVPLGNLVYLSKSNVEKNMPKENIYMVLGSDFFLDFLNFQIK